MDANRCKKKDHAGEGCIRAAGHAGRCKVRELAGQAPGPKLARAAAKIPARATPADAVAVQAQACELASAFGLTRLAVDPEGGRFAFAAPDGAAVLVDAPNGTVSRGAMAFTSAGSHDRDFSAAAFADAAGVATARVGTDLYFILPGGRAICLSEAGALFNAELRKTGEI